MTGRQERNRQIEDRVKGLMVGQPKVVEDFFYSLVDKSAHTKGRYTEYLMEYLKYLDEIGFDYSDLKNFAEVKPSHIAKYLEYIRFAYTKSGKKKETTEATRAAKFYGIKKFYDFLMNEEYIENNPCDKVKPPKCTGEKEVVAMTREEVHILYNNIRNGVGSKLAKSRQKLFRNRDLAIVTLGCTTGLRVSSICEINMEDIDFENRTIQVREKGNKIRVIHVGENTMETIRCWVVDRSWLFECDAWVVEEGMPLFVTRNGNRMCPTDIDNMIKKYSVGIDKPITPHKMRSTCATNLYEATGDIFLVQDILGHKNIANTRRYAKMSEKRREEAVNILDKM